MIAQRKYHNYLIYNKIGGVARQGFLRSDLIYSSLGMLTAYRRPLFFDLNR